MVDVGAKEVTARRAVARAGGARFTAERVAATRQGDAPAWRGRASSGQAHGELSRCATRSARPRRRRRRFRPAEGTVTLTASAAVTAWHGRRDGGHDRRRRRADRLRHQGLERGVRVEAVELLSKSGGRSGDWRRDAP
jgi:hypothetical protein